MCYDTLYLSSAGSPFAFSFLSLAFTFIFFSPIFLDARLRFSLDLLCLGRLIVFIRTVFTIKSPAQLMLLPCRSLLAADGFPFRVDWLFFGHSISAPWEQSLVLLGKPHVAWSSGFCHQIQRLLAFTMRFSSKINLIGCEAILDFPIVKLMFANSSTAADISQCRSSTCRFEIPSHANHLHFAFRPAKRSVAFR